MPLARKLFIVLCVTFAATLQPAVAAEPDKAILVTGASSGLGRAITEDLAGRGYFVYAGARKDADIADLNDIDNVEGVRLDVNVQSDIDAAVARIRTAGRGLYGLVNNAGVYVLSPLIEISEEDFHFQMNVNVYGVYRVTRAFAPLIIESRGRITTMGSISGTLSSATWGPYSMTKHAMEAFTDALADEMSRFDVKVSIIEPGPYTSKITQSMFSRREEQQIDTDDSQFTDELEENLDWSKNVLANSGDPAEVADTAYRALFEDNPKLRYMIVPTRATAEGTIRKGLQKTVQMNADQEFTLSRDELIRMLDEELAKADRAM